MPLPLPLAEVRWKSWRYSLLTRFEFILRRVTKVSYPRKGCKGEDTVRPSEGKRYEEAAGGVTFSFIHSLIHPEPSPRPHDYHLHLHHFTAGPHPPPHPAPLSPPPFPISHFPVLAPCHGTCKLLHPPRPNPPTRPTKKAPHISPPFLPPTRSK